MWEPIRIQLQIILKWLVVHTTHSNLTLKKLHPTWLSGYCETGNSMCLVQNSTVMFILLSKQFIKRLKKLLPPRIVIFLCWWKISTLSLAHFQFCSYFPSLRKMQFCNTQNVVKLMASQVVLAYRTYFLKYFISVAEIQHSCSKHT